MRFQGYKECPDRAEKAVKIRLHPSKPHLRWTPFLVDVSDIFYFFLLGGVGKGSPRGREGGGGAIFHGKSQEGGGGSPRRVEAEGRGAGRVFEGNLGIWGGGAKYFFSGPKFPPSLVPVSPEGPFKTPSRTLRKPFKNQGALKGTNLRGQTEPKRRFSLIFADSRRFLENEAFGKRRFSQETADFRRNPQKTAGTCRKPQIGGCPLRFVPLSAPLKKVSKSRNR